MGVHGHLEFEQEHFDTLVIGGGQAGLAVGHSLARAGVPFVILDADDRIGDAWRKRWDSLRLFSPRRYDGLPEMPFPGIPSSFPTKDEMADYLEAYAQRFDLPVRSGVRVDRLTRNGKGFEVTAGKRRITADNVVVAMGTHQVPWCSPYDQKSIPMGCLSFVRGRKPSPRPESSACPRSSGLIMDSPSSKMVG